MASTNLSGTRDTLYSQWQKDVALARKARKDLQDDDQAADLEKVAAQHQGALEIAQMEGDTTTGVAKMRTQAERELAQMKIAAETIDNSLNRETEVALRNTQEAGADRRNKASLDSELARTRLSINPWSPASKQAEAALLDAQTRSNATLMSGPTPLELNESLYKATHDEKGKRIPLAASDKSALDLAAMSGGMKLIPGEQRYKTIVPPVLLPNILAKQSKKTLDGKTILADRDWNKWAVQQDYNIAPINDPNAVAKMKRRPGTLNWKP